VCEQDQRPGAAKQFAEDALVFYRQAGFLREFVQVTGLLAGVYEQLAEYERGIRTSREALEGALRLKDKGSEALVRARLSRNLLWSGFWPEALDEYRRAAELQGNGGPGVNARLACAQLSLWLGQGKAAARIMQEVQHFLDKETDAPFRSAFLARKAEVTYDAEDWNKTLAFANDGLFTPTRDEEADRDLSLFKALALIRAGQQNEGAAQAAALIRKLDSEKLIGSAAYARLSLAEAWVAVGNRSAARPLLIEVTPFFETRQIWESSWRLHALAAQTAENPAETEAHRIQAGSAFTKLKAHWPAENVAGYLSRPAIRQLLSQART
jgi:hypothetical protein